MKHKKIWLSIFISIVFLIMAACGSAETPAMPTPLPSTETPTLTVSTLPTNTPLPTSTATLTATSTPTILPPAPLEGLLEGVEVISLETFDNLDKWNLYNAKIMDGSVGFDETLPPGGWITYEYEFEEGEGVLFNIQYTGKRAGIYGYCFGNYYQTDYDKQFCVSQFQYPYIFRGKEYIGLDTLRGQGTVNIKKNTWITVLHVVAPGGTFFTAFWVADDPSRIATKYYDGHYANWSDMAWTFDIYREDQNKTPFIVDDFMLIKFKELIVKK